ncbi:hypothetical protein [Phytohalomonas tamaricis]|uniref:hypothetical protein n=1 Tax=Phytohalomonas tamaricis TaxID=2081032 RepID=UPI000D0B6A83|nr:hypothetical protein [Phytohalomonas tamaricis]
MANYTQFGKNVIFCAPAQMLDQPIRKESPVAAALLPGTVVSLDADGRFAAGAGSVSYVLDRDHLGQGFIDDAYEADDVATAFYPQSALILNVRAAAATAFTEDAPVFVGTDGTITATDPADGTAAYGFAAETITTGDAPELVAVKFV